MTKPAGYRKQDLDLLIPNLHAMTPWGAADAIELARRNEMDMDRWDMMSLIADVCQHFLDRDKGGTR